MPSAGAAIELLLRGRRGRRPKELKELLERLQEQKEQEQQTAASALPPTLTKLRPQEQQQPGDGSTDPASSTPTAGATAQAPQGAAAGKGKGKSDASKAPKEPKTQLREPWGLTGFLDFALAVRVHLPGGGACPSLPLCTQRSDGKALSTAAVHARLVACFKYLLAANPACFYRQLAADALGSGPDAAGAASPIDQIPFGALSANGNAGVGVAFTANGVGSAAHANIVQEGVAASGSSTGSKELVGTQTGKKEHDSAQVGILALDLAFIALAVQSPLCDVLLAPVRGQYPPTDGEILRYCDVIRTACIVPLVDLANSILKAGGAACPNAHEIRAQCTELREAKQYMLCLSFK